MSQETISLAPTVNFGTVFMAAEWTALESPALGSPASEPFSAQSLSQKTVTLPGASPESESVIFVTSGPLQMAQSAAQPVAQPFLQPPVTTMPPPSVQLPEAATPPSSQMLMTGSPPSCPPPVAATPPSPLPQPSAAAAPPGGPAQPELEDSTPGVCGPSAAPQDIKPTGPASSGHACQPSTKLPGPQPA